MSRPAIALVAAGLWIAVAHSQQGAAQDPAPERPNILIIVTDDQRATGTMEVMPATRNLFARQGTTYTDAYATTPVCCPSRASIFTGLYAHNHRVLRNGEDAPDALDHNLTMQRYLQEADYHTAIYGKFFNGWDLADPPPYFDEWAIFRGGYKNSAWNVAGEVQSIPTHSTRYIKSRAVEFIEAGSEQPWMLYLAPYAPHSPFVPEPRFARAAVPEFEPNPATLEIEDDPGGVGDKPPSVQADATTTVDGAARLQRKQLRTLMSLDVMVERVFAALKRTGQVENTLAVFTSDNGYMWGEHGLKAKAVPYIQSTQVPLFVRWPGRMDAGAIDDRLTANIDIAPTVLDAVDIVPDEEMDGRSLLWPGSRERLLLETFGARKSSEETFYWASIKTKELQYTEWYLDPDQTVPEFIEYYDLVTDPWQLHNAVVEGSPLRSAEYLDLALMLRQDRSCQGTSCP